MGVLPAPTPGSALQSIQSTVVQLATPLLLFGADLKVVLRQTGRLLAMFLLGSAASVVGSIVAYALLAGARAPTLRRVPRHRFFSQLQKERSGGSARELAVFGRRCAHFALTAL